MIGKNWWAVELEGKPHNKLDYLPRVKAFYNEFYSRNIAVDFVRTNNDLSNYELVVAPMLYMIKPGEAENLERFVQNGGTLITSFFSGIVDENDRIHLGGYPAPLRKLLGLTVDEFVPYADNEENSFIYNSQKASCSMWTDIIKLEGAKTIAHYTSGWFKGEPAVTLNRFGKGKAVYIGTEPDSTYLGELLAGLASEEN